MLRPMTRLPRALFLFLFVSCASGLPFMPTVDGGAGGSGGTTATGGGGAGGTLGSGGSDVFGGSGGAPPLVDASTCSPLVETYMPACVTCLGANCCAVATACVAVSDCIGYASCQQNCLPLPAGSPDGGTNICLTACATNYPMANPTFAAMTACLHQSCAGPCPY
jgi:hypothetical protein